MPVHKLLLDIPTRIETERLVLRCYQPGDGPWYYAMSQRNRAHLERYESDNVVMTLTSEEDAEIAVRDFAVGWAARSYFFLGAFSRETDAFVAQIYFEHLKAHRVRLECDEANVRSHRVAERCGMVKEGHIRENKKNPDGTLSGTLHYGLLRSEFAAVE